MMQLLAKMGGGTPDGDDDGKGDEGGPRVQIYGNPSTNLDASVGSMQFAASNDPTEEDDFDVEEEENVDMFVQEQEAHSPRYPIVSKMAKDILAVPVSSVASECAFSTCGRVLTDFRSSLTPKSVQALICAQDWLYPRTIKMPEVEEKLEMLEMIEGGGEIPERAEDEEDGQSESEEEEEEEESEDSEYSEDEEEEDEDEIEDFTASVS